MLSIVIEEDERKKEKGRNRRVLLQKIRKIWNVIDCETIVKKRRERE